MLVAALLAVTALGGTWSFTPIPASPAADHEYSVMWLTADGKRALIWDHTEERTSFGIWAEGKGMSPLTVKAGFYPMVISNDASLIAGEVESGPDEEEMPGFVWTAASGYRTLMLEGEQSRRYTKITAISADGSTVVGTSAHRAFRWNAKEGMVGFDWIHRLARFEAVGVSTDGSVIAGTTMTPAPKGDSAAKLGHVHERMFLWSRIDGRRVIPLPTGYMAAHAERLSDDGRSVVGYATKISGTDVDQVGYVWSESSGYTLMQGASKHQTFWPHTISGDGRIVAGYTFVVGEGEYSTRTVAWVWTRGGGVKYVKDLLVANGVKEVEKWNLDSVKGISSDGHTIAGIAYDKDLKRRSWIARIEL